MSIENLLQNFANSTGIIIDRTINPPRILGQAFLVSKSRVVTCASCIFNYNESPWALAVKFPHPDLVLGVKTLSLHPEFDRKEARLSYLGQTASSRFNYPVQFNDLATMIIQPELKEPEPELVAQLHRVLTVPFPSDGGGISGPMARKEFHDIVKKVLESKQSGLLTIFDQLNIPIAYLQITAGTIDRVYFQGIIGEMAFAELIYRQPAGGYSFAPEYEFAWGNFRKIEMPAEILINESIKRAEELPAILHSLGGAQARYQRVIKEFNPGSFEQNVQWLINNLWQAIDGYITIDSLGERVGSDTYTVTQGLRELSNRGVVSLINRQSPFHCNQQLGTPIISHTDFDINPGDTLKAFYLDPLSGAPCWLDGNFAGVASVLQPKNLLHSIPIHLRVPGALILKNYKLIGVHNGAIQMKPGQVNSERQLFQMMWIGALFDMGTKKLRGTGAEATDTEYTESSTASGSNLTSLRERNAENNKTSVTTEKLSAYICPHCYATNTKLGPCFNCGTIIEAPIEKPKREGFFISTLPVKLISDWQDKYNLSDRKIFIGIGIFAITIMFLGIIIVSGNSGSVNQPSIPINTTKNVNAEQAVKLAVSVVGLKGTAPPGYWFAETSSSTSPLSSFTMLSDASNQKILFAIFNDLSPVQSLDRFTTIPPFSDVVASNEDTHEKVKITEGSQIIGENQMHYFVYHYPLANNKSKNMLIGSFPAKESGKSILVIGQSLKEDIYDYKSTLFLIDTMAEDLTNAANKKIIDKTTSQKPIINEISKPVKSDTQKTTPESAANTPDNKPDSEEKINQYCRDLQKDLQKKVALSADLQEQIKKRKNDKLKIVLAVDLELDGHLSKIEITEPDNRQKTNDELVRLINSGTPYAHVPKTENNVLSLQITFKKGNLAVERSD